MLTSNFFGAYTLGFDEKPLDLYNQNPDYIKEQTEKHGHDTAYKVYQVTVARSGMKDMVVEIVTTCAQKAVRIAAGRSTKAINIKSVKVFTREGFVDAPDNWNPKGYYRAEVKVNGAEYTVEGEYLCVKQIRSMLRKQFGKKAVIHVFKWLGRYKVRDVKEAAYKPEEYCWKYDVVYAENISDVYGIYREEYPESDGIKIKKPRIDKWESECSEYYWIEVGVDEHILESETVGNFYSKDYVWEDELNFEFV